MAVLDLEKPGSGAEAKLEAEVARALDKGAEAIVLGCAGMADLAQKLSRKFDVPVVDGVAAAVKQAEALAGLKLMTSRRGSYASPGVKKYDRALLGAVRTKDLRLMRGAVDLVAQPAHAGDPAVATGGFSLHVFGDLRVR